MEVIYTGGLYKSAVGESTRGCGDTKIKLRQKKDLVTFFYFYFLLFFFIFSFFEKEDKQISRKALGAM